MAPERIRSMNARAPTVDVFRLARERGRVSGAAALVELPRLAQSVAGGDARVSYSIEGRVDAKGHPGALMTLKARLPLRCERCNEPVEFNLDRAVPFRFVASEQELNAIPVEDDELEIVVGSSAMPLLPWIEDEAILSLPLLPRHEHCSIAYAPADEQASERANPFAVLEGLKKGDGCGSDER
jgi:uncharacterized protein